MKAIGYQVPGDIDEGQSLQDIELERPSPTGYDLLVKIDAISVNPVDTKIRRKFGPEGSDYKILGWDAVGEVVEVGQQVSFYKPGDRVWYAGDLTRSGTNAEFHLVDERMVGRQPKLLSNAEAAAIPLTAITAWELLFDRLQVERATESRGAAAARLLIIGAAGGVGSILVQLAKQLTNAVVIGTASRPESQQWVKELGADFVIDHRQALSDELKRIGIDTVTHVFSLTNSDEHFEQIVESLEPQGKLGLIDDPANLDILLLKQKSISLHWEFMFTRSMFKTHDIEQQRNLLNDISELIDSGHLKATLGEHFGKINAKNLMRAHRQIESGKTIGKIVLEGF